MSNILHGLDSLLCLLFSPFCAACGTTTRESPFCGGCTFLKPIGPKICLSCGMGLSETMQECGECLRREKQYLTTRSTFWLNNEARNVMHKVKYSHSISLLRLLWIRALSSIERFVPDDTVVVPIPLHFQREWQRGFNQAEWLGIWYADRFHLNKNVDALKKIRKSDPQAGLSRRKRLKNLKSAFQCVFEKNIPERVLLIDDIFTTGATIEQCARAVRLVGVSRVYGWTLFRVPSTSTRTA